MTSLALNTSNNERRYFEIEPGGWKISIAYCLTLTLVGLKFFPAIAIMLLFWMNAWRKDRYAFLIQVSIFAGGFGLLNINTLKIFTGDFALLASALLWFVMRKAPILRKTLWAMGAYFAMLFILAMMSIESMVVQFYIVRTWLLIAYIIVPFAVFAGRDFVFDTFLNKFFPYVLVISVFYIFDAYVFCGNVLAPGTKGYGESFFYSPYWQPLSGNFFRKYPPGMYLYAFFLEPVARRYKLRLWQWAIIFVAVVCTKTFTLIACLLLGYILFQGNKKLIIKCGVAGVVLLGVAYVVDSYLPTNKDDDYEQSYLRIKSSVDQFTALVEAADDEDIAEFGSGRIAQFIPKADLVINENREWIGLGFLHPDKTHINQYIIDNEYYNDIEQSIEVATGVEIIPLQVWINVGWIGLIGHCLFFWALWMFVRKLPNSVYFLSVLYYNFLMGLSGFAGLIYIHGLILTSVAYAVVILPQRHTLVGPSAPWMSLRQARKHKLLG